MRDAGRQSITVSTQISSRDGALEVEHRRFTFRGDAEHDHTLGHAGEEQVGLFDGPCVRPSVVLDQQLAEWVGGLLTKQTVGGNDSKATPLVQNLEASLDEQAVQVHVAAHR